MLYLIKTELYKKRKLFLLLLVFNLLPLFYSLGMRFDWSFILISGQTDMIWFCSVMWEMLFLTGIPLAFFAFISANILGGEISNGQILLETPRVGKRSKIVSSKIIAVLIILVYFFLETIFFSAVCYIVNVKGTEYAATSIINFDSGTNRVLMNLAFGLIYYFAVCLFSFCVSINFSVIKTALVCMGMHVVLKLLSMINTISLIVPGAIALNSEMTVDLKTIIIQSVLLGCIILIMAIVTIKRFEKKDL